MANFTVGVYPTLTIIFSFCTVFCLHACRIN